MERRSRGSEVVVVSERRSNSGVYRSVQPHLLGQLRKELKAASERVHSFRSNIAERRQALGAEGEQDVSWRALQEIDTAHEELRVVEEELHAQAEEILAMRETMDRDRRIYTELFEAAPEAYLVTDDRGAIIQANRRAGTLFNLDPSLLIGKPLVSLVVHDDRTAFRDLLSAMSETVFHTELRFQPRRDAERIWVSLSAQRGVRDERAICIRWQMRDISPEKAEARRIAVEEMLRNRVREVEASLASLGHILERDQRALSEADERAREKEQILAEVAHELRSPLGAIAGWLHALSQEQGDPSTRQRAIASMTRGVRTIANMVDELFEHARLENHRVVLQVGALNLLRVVIEVMEDIRPIAELKKLRMEFSAKPYKVDISGDAWRLQQVFRNLIGNAIKFTPEQGSVHIAVAVSGSQAEVTIKDTGRGIPREALGKIFQPFAQLLAPGARPTGLGLGLSIAQRLVELHGGTVHAESDGPQCGATFRVRLPLFAPN